MTEIEKKAAEKTIDELSATADRKAGEPCEPLLRGYIRQLEKECGVAQ